MAGTTDESVIGIDVGGTKILAIAFDPSNPANIRAEAHVPTPSGADSLVEALVTVVRGLDQPAGVPVGMGIAGLVDRSGRLHIGPNLPGVIDTPFQEVLASGLDRSVVVVNDASAAAWAEYRLGAGRRSSDMAMVTLGTGIGGGFVLDGELYAGARGFAGEPGHMVVDPDGPLCPCGRHGCWERYASGFGLGRLARDAALGGRNGAAVHRAGGDPEAVRGEHVTAAAADGDSEALAVLDRFSWWLALGLANIAALIDPDVVVLGGGVIDAHHLFLPPTRRHFGELLMSADRRPPIAVEAAVLGPGAGAIGAGLLGAL